MFNAFRRLNKLLVPTSSRFSSRTLPLTFKFAADNMADVLKQAQEPGSLNHPWNLENMDDNCTIWNSRSVILVRYSVFLLSVFSKLSA